MVLGDILPLSRVELVSGALGKDGMLRRIAKLFSADDPSLDEAATYLVLVQREQLASTGVGSGVAIPHGRIAGLDAIRAALLVHHDGVSFDAIDGEAASIFVAILSPAEKSHHLKVLADFSRRLREQRVRAAVLSAASAEDARSALLEG